MVNRRLTPIEMMVDKACGLQSNGFAVHRSSFDSDLDRMKAELFDFIAHGDEQHRAWLREAIDAYFAGSERPELKSGV